MQKRKPTRNKNPTPGDARLLIDGVCVKEQPLNEREQELVRRAYELFDFFRDKLSDAHEEMYEARAMRQLAQSGKSRTSAPSMTLNSCIDNVIADQMDNMPEAVLVPERQETEQSAEEMTDVIGFVLYQAGWPGKYQKLMEDAVVTGTGVAQAFWNDDAMDGEGMVDIIAWHPEDFFPDPMYENIQDGRGVFKTTNTTVAWVEEHYPEAKGYVRADDIRPDDEASMLRDTPKGDEKVTLLEFWYKRYDAEKRKTRVHMAQFAGRALLYSTELGFGCSESDYKEGVYAHGQYPFHMFKYRDVFRQPFGTGLTHDYKDTQLTIDRYQKYIDDNARESSIQRHVVRRGSGVNAEDVADMSKQVIEWDGANIREVIQTIQASPLNGQVYQMMNFMVDAMKQDSGQNQFNRGEGGGGITAASAISQLVAQGGKITRLHVEQFKDTFREMIEQVLWVLADYISEKRVIKIVGGWDSGMGMQNRLIELHSPPKDGDRLLKPAYSVRVQVQKHNPVWSERFNELLMRAAEISSQGGKPIPADILMSAIQGFPDKGRIVRMLREVGTMHDQIAQMEQQMAQMQQQLEAKDAVIRADAQAMGAPSIERMMQKPGGNPNYAALAEAASSAGKKPV